MTLGAKVPFKKGQKFSKGEPNAARKKDLEAKRGRAVAIHGSKAKALAAEAKK